MLGVGKIQRLLSVARRDHVKAGIAQLQRDDVENMALIISDEDFLVRVHVSYSHRSSSNPKQLPFPTWLSTKIRPWCTVSTMCFTSDKPNPVPLAIRLLASAL